VAKEGYLGAVLLVCGSRPAASPARQRSDVSRLFVPCSRVLTKPSGESRAAGTHSPDQIAFPVGAVVVEDVSIGRRLLGRRCGGVARGGFGSSAGSTVQDRVGARREVVNDDRRLRQRGYPDGLSKGYPMATCSTANEMEQLSNKRGASGRKRSARQSRENGLN